MIHKLLGVLGLATPTSKTIENTAVPEWTIVPSLETTVLHRYVDEELDEVRYNLNKKLFHWLKIWEERKPTGSCSSSLSAYVGNILCSLVDR